MIAMQSEGQAPDQWVCTSWRLGERLLRIFIDVRHNRLRMSQQCRADGGRDLAGPPTAAALRHPIKLGLLSVARP